jgi:transcriptional regulator with XRE-family HTH domain
MCNFIFCKVPFMQKRYKMNRMKTQFSSWVKETRKGLDLTQAALGKKIGKDQSYISRIESGIEGLSLDEIRVIGIALGDESGAVEAAKAKTIVVPTEIERVRDARELALIQRYRGSDPVGQSAIDAVAEAVSGNNVKTVTEETPLSSLLGGGKVNAARKQREENLKE